MTMAISTLVRRHSAVVLATLSAACGGGGTEPEPSGPPSDVSVSAGNQQTGQAGSLLTAPIAAKVTDADGRGVPNIPVLFFVAAGGGIVDPTTARTNGAGIATTNWRVGSTVGAEQRVIASVLDTLTGALVDTAVFVASVAAGPPAAVQAVAGNGVVLAAGQSATINLRAAVRDAYGNAAAGVTVAWTVVTGQASLAAASSVTNAQGQATNVLTVTQAQGEIEVRASVTGASPAIFVVTTQFVSERAALLSGGAFGIARTPSGQLVVTLISRGQLERITTSNGASALATVGGTPVVIAVDAAGQRAYAANMGTGTLNVVDVPTMTVVADVDIPGEAHALAMSPRGDRVYVTNTSNSVFAVDVASRAIVRTTTVGAGPWGIAFWTTATDSLMYVTARDGGSISEVDMRTGSVVRTIGVSGRPHGLAIAPNGSTLYIAEDTQGQILFVNRASGAIAQRITASGAFGIAVAPDGNTLYVTTNGGDILVVDVASAAIIKRVSTGGQARQIIAMPDGSGALAANMSGWVDLVRR